MKVDPGVAVADDEQAFALGLLRRLAPTTANLVLSPWGIDTLMAMLEPGAAGATRAGIAKALQSSGLSAAQQAAQWKVFDQGLASGAASEHVALESANQTWVQVGVPLRPSYTALLSSDFGSSVQKEDFASDPSGAASAVDHWVAARTARHITRLVTAKELSDIKVLSVDAVYMLAPWLEPFSPSQTSPVPFHVSRARTVTVQMMSDDEQEQDASASASLDAVGLSYRGGDLSALVLMPPLGRLAGFERDLTPARLDGIENGLRPQAFSLQLPRFSLNRSLNLKKVLTGMGMARSFSTSANFSNLSPQHLALNFVVQDAQVEVNETGTEASAGSGAGGGVGAIPVALSIVVDHPFLFLVLDNATRSILFEAQVSDPAAN